MPAVFDHYVIVDWSAAARPKTGRDSIWICHRGPHGEICENPPTRHLAKRQLTWFRRDHEIRWLHPENQRQEIIESIQRFFH